MRYRVRHTTRYEYELPVNVCHNRVCLTPKNQPNQTRIKSQVLIDPVPNELRNRVDYYGNELIFFSIYKEHEILEVTSRSEVTLEPAIATAQAQTSPILWQDIRGVLDQENEFKIVEYTLPSQFIPHSPEVMHFAKDCFVNGASMWTVCHDLMTKIFRDIEFKPGFTTINTPVETVIKARKGVCQDFAHLMITALRGFGIPARYVSGYLETLPPPGKKKLIGADASHAWVSVYFPSIGWVDFDPTNGLLPAAKHITVAHGRDYMDVAPIKGIVFSSGEQQLKVEVDVESI